MVDTAVVALVETGRVRAQTAGDLQVVQDSPPARGRGARAGQARGAELGDVDTIIATVSRRLLNQSTPGLPSAEIRIGANLTWATPAGGVW